jgi:hypothetical protein
VHEVYHPKNADGVEGLHRELEAAMGFNDALRPNLGRCADDLHPLRAQALLAAIPDDALVRRLAWGYGGGPSARLARCAVAWQAA